MYSLIPSNKTTLFDKSAKTINNLLIILMELQETKQRNQTSTQVHESENFPFLIVEQKEYDEQNNEISCTCRIALQNNIVSQKTFNSVEEAEEYISKPQWDLILNLVYITIETLYKNEDKN